MYVCSTRVLKVWQFQEDTDWMLHANECSHIQTRHHFGISATWVKTSLCLVNWRVFFTNGTFLPLNSNNPTDLAYPHSTWRGTNWIYVMHIHSSWSPGSLFHNNFTPTITSHMLNLTKGPMKQKSTWAIKKNPAIITTALTGFEQQQHFSASTIWRSIVTLTFALPYVVPNLNYFLSILFVEHK